jgi:hypothetical protein
MRTPKVGADDFLAAGGHLDGLDRAEPPRPMIGVSGDLPAMTREAWAALIAANDPPRLFCRGAVPVRLEDDVPPRTRLLTPDRMRYALARASRWERTEKTKKGPRVVEALPPLAVVRDLLATPTPPLPRLARIVTTPTFTPSGRIRVVPGYDPDGCSYFAPPPDLVVPTVPDCPSPEQIGAAALFLLQDYLGDFPFTGVAEAAHALALLLLPFVRELIDGPTPLHLVEASTPGTGKTLLVDACLWPALGQAAPMMAEARDDDEWRKRITAKLLASAAVVCLDNLRRPLDSGALASALTATVHEDRILGRSDVEAVPVRCIWAATGNNPRLSLEIARRAIRIRLDARTEQPWLRTGFRLPDILAWASAHRGRINAAALTLGQAWIAAGRPRGSVRLGMYERWAEVMGGILAVAGVDGFLANREQFYKRADPEGAEHRAFLAAWWSRHADGHVTTSELLKVDPLPSRIEESERGRGHRLGKLLSALCDRHFGLGDGLTVRIERVGEVQGAALWRLGSS